METTTRTEFRWSPIPILENGLWLAFLALMFGLLLWQL